MFISDLPKEMQAVAREDFIQRVTDDLVNYSGDFEADGFFAQIRAGNYDKKLAVPMSWIDGLKNG